MGYLKRLGLGKANYDKYPVVEVRGHEKECWQGWGSVVDVLANAISVSQKRMIAIECYAGVSEDEIETALKKVISGARFYRTQNAFIPPEAVDRLVEPYLGGNDPIFGYLTRLAMEDFFDPQKMELLRNEIAVQTGTVIIIGAGALLCCEPDLVVYADMPRWEGQLRQRRGEVSNLGVNNKGLKASLQYKRSFFIDWRVCDKLKRKTFEKWDFFLDTTIPSNPKMITGAAFRDGMKEAVSRPFRVVPFFDPGPWGGQWMREVCDLGKNEPNFAWCFDCVPEENSLYLGFGEVRVEVPSINLVFYRPKELLGESVYGRFGAEFPIRFDFLDTMGGGNLSFQVHPTVDYANEHFGLRYTQDESYYLLDAEEGAVVYLGIKDGAKPEEFLESLEAAQKGGKPFDDGKFVGRFPAKKHDHFLIPAGTLHCSGADSMVLEISATPYIFTFKLWDWNRLGLDGKPRPINIERGRHVIQWDRDETWAKENLVGQVVSLASGEGWREERTGLHPSEFIETRRHWFTKPVVHRRTGSVEVLNLVEGEAAVVESVESRFDPFTVHYAETFILPDAAGDYRIFPQTPGKTCATLKAYVRSSGG